MRYPEQYQYYCWFARNKVKEPELQRLLIVMADHIGADDPILIEDLATVVYDNRNAERKVRDGLETLRTDYGIPIGSNAGKPGRWIVIDNEDLFHTTNELRSRAYRMLETARKLDKTNLRPVLSPEAMRNAGQGRLW